MNQNKLNVKLIILPRLFDEADSLLERSILETAEDLEDPLEIQVDSSWVCQQGRLRRLDVRAE